MFFIGYIWIREIILLEWFWVHLEFRILSSAEFCRKCNPVRTVVKYYTWFMLFLSSTDLVYFGYSMNKIVVFSALIPFLLLAFFARISLLASVTTERHFPSTTSCLGSPPNVGIEKNASRTSNPSENGLQTDPALRFFVLHKISLRCREFKMVLPSVW